LEVVGGGGGGDDDDDDILMLIGDHQTLRDDFAIHVGNHDNESLEYGIFA